jgi:putative nucleotidyltransferase with HDIG domain
VRTPPRLIARTLAVILVTVMAILSVVFIVLTIETRDRVRTAESEKLRISGGAFSQMERRLQRERLVMTGALGEQPRVKAVIDTYFSEIAFGGVSADRAADLRRTVTQELEKVVGGMNNDTLVVMDLTGRVFAAAGHSSGKWPAGAQIAIDGGARRTFQDVAIVPGGDVFSVTGVALQLDGDRDVGTMLLATPLDADFAEELSRMTGAGIVIASGDRVLARTVSQPVATELAAAAPDNQRPHSLQGEEYAIALLFDQGSVRIYSLSSIDEAARAATRSALIALASVALGSFSLAMLGSLWLARTLTNPIDSLSREIEAMSAMRAFGQTVALPGTSRELDALASAFNDLMRGLLKAEAESRAAYLGAIRALAAALDARDPYTAGHSERVSAYSVLIARELGLPEADVDVIRLGALLHDIGKIGVSDEILRKPGPLTPDELDHIKRHPALGARILRQVSFLAPHLPIVELHHERPDGRGYPYGLRGHDIPLAARIVHVADAFDAMTSARAYRPARGTAFALDELRRGSASDFDPACVEAMCAALPSTSPILEPQLQELLGRGV